EVAHLSQVAIELDYAALPWLGEVHGYAAQHIFPGGAERNEAYYARWVRLAPELNLSDWELRLLHDPETSGGLLIAVGAEHLAELVDGLRVVGEEAFVIGDVAPGAGEVIIRPGSPH